MIENRNISNDVTVTEKDDGGNVTYELSPQDFAALTATATVLQLKVNETIQADTCVHCLERTEHWFKLIVLHEADYSFSANACVSAKLYDAEGNPLVSDNEDGENNGFLINFTLVRDRVYYLRITPNQYGFSRFNTIIDGVYTSPYAESMATAQEIYIGSQVTGYFSQSEKEQWYKFTVPRNQQYTIHTTGALNTIGTLYDNFGYLITEQNGYEPAGSLNFRMRRFLFADTVYYVQVKEANEKSGTFKLTVTEQQLADSVSINTSELVLGKVGTIYELPMRPNTFTNIDGAEPLEDISATVMPQTVEDKLVQWYSFDYGVISIESGWCNGQRCQKMTVVGEGTAKLYAKDWAGNGKRGECIVRVVTPYEKQLQFSCGFSSEEANLILKLYDKVEATFTSESTIEKAWKCARLLSEFCYDSPSSILGIQFNKWDDVAGSVTTEGGRKEYFINTLGYTENEYNKLQNALLRNHQDANTNQIIIDFTHMQYALAARLAYTLNKDDILSNLGTGLYTGNYGIYTDEQISYLAGWFGDAILRNISGVGEPVMKNDDYMADLDAENIYRLIIQGISAIAAANEYYSNMTSSNTRAIIFLQHIPYDTVKEKIFYELIDAQLYALLSNASNQGNIVLVNYYLNLLNDEQYHFDTIKANYCDTYNFLKSLNDRLLTMEHYS